MDGTLMHKTMHADPENYVTSMAPGQYWTWGTHMRGMKGKRPNMCAKLSSLTVMLIFICNMPVKNANFVACPCLMSRLHWTENKSAVCIKTTTQEEVNFVQWVDSILHLRHITEYKMSPSTSGVTSRPWTPRCTPPPQQQQPSISTHPHPHPPPDYHHNMYIPGTPSGFCTLRPTAQRSELDVHNSFSTFGKKRRLQMSPQGEAAIINNDLYNDWLINNCLNG